MNDNMICSKVNSMLALFIDGKLTTMQEEFVKDHLATCNGCRTKYDYLKKLVDTLKSSYQENKEQIKTASGGLKIKEYEYYKQNLSAYFDNELPFEDSVRFKKYIMKIPLARQELQRVYDLQQMLKNNWIYNQKKLNQDFSKSVINTVYKDNVRYLQTTIWSKVAAIIFAIFLLGSATAVYYYAKQNADFPPTAKPEQKAVAIK